MKFLELSPGVSVNTESIDIIVEAPEGQTRVHIGEEVYMTPIPYTTFKNLLIRQIGTQDIAKNIEQLAQFQTQPTP